MTQYEVTVHHDAWGETRKHSVEAFGARDAVSEAAEIEYDEWGFDDVPAMKYLRFEVEGRFYQVEVDWSPNFHVGELDQ